MDHNWVVYNLERLSDIEAVTQVTFVCESSHTHLGTVFPDKTICIENLATKSHTDSDFVEYNDLTEDIVLGWVTGSIDKTGIEFTLSQSIAERITLVDSPVLLGGTPW
jgi:hypothetical protein|tara:strand:- start:3992 stop:4315 length:324 start_codon:yes stop_codon:yes gene_type:complete